MVRNTTSGVTRAKCIPLVPRLSDKDEQRMQVAIGENKETKKVENKDQQYVITSGPDGVLWVSLQPLLSDIRLELARQMVAEDAVRVQALETVAGFVESLIREGATNVANTH